MMRYRTLKNTLLNAQNKSNTPSGTEDKTNLLPTRKPNAGNFMQVTMDFKSSEVSAKHSVDSDSVTIKIPGAQILGWFLGPIPSTEKAAKYEQMLSGYLPEIPSKLA